MAQKIITIILGLAVVAALAWYVNKNYIQPTSEATDIKITNKDAAKSQDGTSKETSAAESLVYVNRGSATIIWSRDSSGNAKKIFTDADETDKLFTLSNVSSAASNILAVVSKGSKSMGRLVSIDLKTAKETKVRDSFPAPENLAVSKDGSLFSYTRFSNVEANYGFTLYYEPVGEGAPIEVSKSDYEIISPAFSPSSTKIAYANAAGKNTELFSYSISAKKSDKIATLVGKAVDSLSWPSADKIIISVRKIGTENSGEIDVVNPNTGEIEKIANFSGGRASFIFLDSPADRLAFIVAQYKDKVETDISGQLYVVEIATGKKETLEKCNQILGWMSS